MFVCFFIVVSWGGVFLKCFLVVGFVWVVVLFLGGVLFWGRGLLLVLGVFILFFILFVFYFYFFIVCVCFVFWVFFCLF